MNAKAVSSGFTRRKFLQTTAATAAVAAVGKTLFGGPVSTLVENAGAAVQNPPQDEWKFATCRMCYFNRCATRVRVQNGVVTGIAGQTGWPQSDGRLCARGHAAIFNLYNPYRVKAPLKRTNPKRGLDVDPGWVEISWDEALNILAGKLKEIRKQDPRQFLWHEGFSRQGRFIPDRTFATAFRTTNFFRSNGPLCAVHYAPSITQALFTSENFDPLYCDYLIMVGGTLKAGPGLVPGHNFVEAVDRGMKLVSVDPRCTPEASKGEWIPIRPGTELAFLLAMTHVILHELNTFDVSFVKNRTNGPYLIGPDGYYLRDPAGKKPLIWDPEDKKAKTFDDPTIKDYALEGSFAVRGVQARPAFALLKDHVKQYTPEWSQDITTIPVQTIRRITREFVEAARIGSTIEIDGFTFPLRPVAVKAGRGSISHKGGTYLHLATKILDALVGSLDMPGGDLADAFGPILKPNEDGVVTPIGEAVGEPFEYPPQRVDLKGYFPNSHHMPHLAFRVINDPKRYGLEYRIQAMLMHGSNSLQHNAGPEPVVEAYQKIPFIASIAYHFDEPTELSDLVLPEPSVLERYISTGGERGPNMEAFGQGGVAFIGTAVQHPVVKPMYNTRLVDDIMIEIAERVGFLYGERGLIAGLNRGFADPYKLDVTRKPTVTDLWDARLKTDFGSQYGLEYFKNHGYLVSKRPSRKATYNYFYFPGNKTRHPIYFDHLKAVGDQLRENMAAHNVTLPGWDMNDLFDYYKPLPHWKPHPEHLEPAEFDLYVVNWKTAQFQFSLSGTVENPWLMEVAQTFDPYSFSICMNRTTAARKGLKDGDKVRVESPYGKVEGTLKTSELFHPEVVGIGGCFGRRSMHMNPAAKLGPNYNQLLTADDGKYDPISGGMEITARVKIKKI